MRKLAFVFALLILAIPCQARVITVDDDGPADFNNIQSAIDDANGGDIVEVQPGTYTGLGNRDINFLGKAITVRSTDPNDPNIIAVTVIDCEDSGRGFKFENGEGPNSVLEGLTIRNGLVYTYYGGAIYCKDSSPTIKYCTITLNMATKPFSGRKRPEGGGIYCLNSSPMISNCTISSNTSYGGYGGGISCNYSNPKISNCTISNNWVAYLGKAGGGICCKNSDPNISNCIITSNYAPMGGGVACYTNSSPTLIDCTLINNQARFTGGGMYNRSNSCPILRNCTFSENSARGMLVTFGGGMINTDASSPILINCTFNNNRTKTKGAGMYNNISSNPRLINCVFRNNFVQSNGGAIYNRRSRPMLNNCLFSRNSAGRHGGGMYNENRNSNPILINCTFSCNSAEQKAGGIYNESDNTPNLTNCILWNNSDKEGTYELAQMQGGTPVVNFSCMQGWAGTFGGVGNIGDNPWFVEPGYWADACDPNIIVEPNDPNAVWIEGDYHLLEDSPCIDTGDPNYVAGPNETDLDGNLRIVDGDNDGNSVVDMGAYEYRPPTPAELIAELLEEVGGLGLPSGIENGLEAKLNAALQALEDENENNDAAAINTLEALINAVEAQHGKKIPEAEADVLIAAAQEIIELLSGG